ncbi:MAG: hypothetical protein AB4080_03245 [Trichodesmium sp.]
MTMNQRTTEHSEKSRFKEPVSVDNLADNLMEDLFQDIDRVLDGGSRLPTKVERPEMVSLTQIKVPQIVLPQPPTQLQDPDKEEKEKLAKAEQEKKENKSLDKLLLGAAFASIFVTVSLWLVNRGGLDKILGYLGYIEKPDESAETLNQREAADAKFADYIERSLKMIEQQEASQKQQQIPGIPVPPSTNNLPTVPIPANLSPNSSLILPLNRLIDLMEAQVAKEPVTVPETKVVVMPPAPIVVPTAVAQTTTPQSSPKPSAASDSNASTEAAKNGEDNGEATATATTKVEEQAQTSPEVAVKPEPEAKPEPETKPEPEAKSEPQTETATESQTEAPEEPISLPPPPTEIPTTEIVGTSQVPTPMNTLVGILELGERSAALFEIDGVARRIYVGESIGGSGWTLVKVSNQEAVIRRNGDVLSVFVGQQF